jgi:hypothetical protein
MLWSDGPESLHLEGSRLAVSLQHVPYADQKVTEAVSPDREYLIVVYIASHTLDIDLVRNINSIEVAHYDPIFSWGQGVSTCNVHTPGHPVTCETPQTIAASLTSEDQHPWNECSFCPGPHEGSGNPGCISNMFCSVGLGSTWRQSLLSEGQIYPY